MIALACGAKTYKLKFGHRGGNHPVKNRKTTPERQPTAPRRYQPLKSPTIRLKARNHLNRKHKKNAADPEKSEFRSECASY